MTEQYPCLIEEDPCGLPVQGLFDPVEEIEQDGQCPFVSHVHQFLVFEDGKGRQGKTVAFGIKQFSHGTINGVGLHGFFDTGYVDKTDEIGQPSVLSVLGHESQGFCDLISLAGTGFDSVQGKDGFDPFLRPGDV